jgi:hypothetical protein
MPKGDFVGQYKRSVAGNRPIQRKRHGQGSPNLRDSYINIAAPSSPMRLYVKTVQNGLWPAFFSFINELRNTYNNDSTNFSVLD